MEEKVQRSAIRKIIHIDMDAFYASVEQHDNPAYKAQPIVVGGDSERGVVAAASYEARKYGIKSAMPSALAIKKCPHLIFVKPRFERYQEISRVIRDVFLEYTNLVEPLSLDEAYLDVTQNKIGPNSATLIAKEIKSKIKDRTGLTASAGVSYNKFLAKTASDVNKPNGLFVILPEDADAYLKKMPIHQFFGIGKATAEKMKMAGIFTGNDLRKKTEKDLIRRFGKSGTYYYNISRGTDNREVKPDRERKSISAENTFDHNIMKLEEVHDRLMAIAKVTLTRYFKQHRRGKTVTIKVKYGDFRQITRSHSLDKNIEREEELTQIIMKLTDPDILSETGIRLLGVGISNFHESRSEPLQLTMGF